MNTGDCLSGPGADASESVQIHLSASLFGLLRSAAAGNATLLVAVVRTRFRLVLLALVAVEEAYSLSGFRGHQVHTLATHSWPARQSHGDEQLAPEGQPL